jgi:two-component system, cell cycle response regulator
MRILVAEDDPVSRRLLETRLSRWGYQTTSTSNGEEAWSCLQQEDAPHLVILDWMMPGMDGIEVCRNVRVRGGEPYTYIILLTAKDSKDDVIRGLEAGADDYLTKPVNAHELEVRLRAGRRIVDLQSELIRAREDLRIQATHDALTGLWNRAAIRDILCRQISRVRRESAPLCISVADIDHFKDINDTLGHGTGDIVLREAAQRLSAAIRQYDFIGRYGGEEFLVVLPGCDENVALKQAERMRASLSETPVLLPEGSVTITISLGITSLVDSDTEDVENLLHAADRALYRAKGEGRNCVRLASRRE